MAIQKRRGQLKTVVAASARETQRIARTLLKRGTRIFALVGELGSGKTTFAQGIARALGIRCRITSPTFIIINRHRIPNSQLTNSPLNKCTDFYHIDLYRIHRVSELTMLNLKKILMRRDAVVVIEWAERARRLMPRSAVWVRFAHGAKRDERSITVIGWRKL